jgi:hypothetical protein
MLGEGPDRVSVRRLDSHADAAATVARAAEEGCAFVIGGIGDKEAIVVADAAETAAVPAVVLGQWPDGRKREWVVWARTPRQEAMTAMARHLAAAGLKKAWILGEDTAFGRAAAAGFKAGFTSASGEVTVERFGPPGADAQKTASEFGRQVADARGKCEPVVLFLTGDFLSSRRLVPFLEFYGAVPRSPPNCPGVVIAGTPLFHDPRAVSRSGDSLVGARFSDIRIVRPPEGVDAAGTLDAEVCDAAGLLASVLAAGRVAERPVIRDRMAAAKWSGCTGDLHVEEGRVVGREIGIFTITRGGIEPWTSSD